MTGSSKERRRGRRQRESEDRRKTVWARARPWTWGATLLAAFGIGNFVDARDTIWPRVGVDIVDQPPSGDELAVEFSATNNGRHEIVNVMSRCAIADATASAGSTHIGMKNVSVTVSKQSEYRLGSGDTHDFLCALGAGSGIQGFNLSDFDIGNADLLVGLEFVPTFFGIPLWWTVTSEQRVKGERRDGKFRWRRSAATL